MAKVPTSLAPRYFRHSVAPSGKEVPKRVEYPERLRKSHVMVTGGREGPLGANKSVASASEPTRTGWKGAPSAGWTKELDKDGTPKDARTQGVYLRRVRPEQRAWARGVMRIPDIEYVLYGGLVPNTAIDLDVEGTPRVELTLWIADEGLFASITGTIEAIRVVTVDNASSIGVNEKARTIENANAVANSSKYAEMLGVVFRPDAEVVFFGEGAVALPYFLIGRARRIHSAVGHDWRVSSHPSADANKPVDTSFSRKLEGIEKMQQEALVEAGVAEALSPKGRFSKDITLDVSMSPAGRNTGLRAMQLTSADANMATSGLADELSLMNVFRTAGAEARSLRGKTPSVLKSPHDPLDFTQKPRKRKKTAPKDSFKMFSNPRISGVNYLVVSAAGLAEMARQAGMSVEEYRRRKPTVITRKESMLLQKQEAAEREAAYAATTFRRPPYKPYTPRTNPFMAETLQDAIEAMTAAHRHLYYELAATSGGQSRASIEHVMHKLELAVRGLGGVLPRHPVD